MGALLDLYMTTEKLETILNTLKAKNEKGVSLTASITDEPNQYGKNVALFVSQSKEEREAKKDKYYVGSGKVFWTDGKITKVEKQAQQVVEQKINTQEILQSDLPF